MEFANRGKTEILAAIIEGARGGSHKTGIIRAANLNHVRGTQYLDHCVEAGLLVKQGDRYVPSEDGKRLLDHWQEIEQRLPGDS